MARLEDGLEEWTDQFVCVRLTEMDDLDLDLFQFDYDLTWVALFLNAEGAVYGRYGARRGNATDPESTLSTASLVACMRRALALHADWPASRDAVAGKRGAPPGWKRVQDIPVPKRSTHGTCFHCHHVLEGMRKAALMAGGERSERLLFPFPEPTAIGLDLERDDGVVVSSALPDSPAGRAGIRAGDVLRRMDGQPLVSRADVQWILHHASAEARLEVAFERDGELQTATVHLEGGWREENLSWRESTWDLRPSLALADLSSLERAALGIENTGLALRISGIRDAARDAGLQNGDVIVEIDGKRVRRTETDLLAEWWREATPGDRIPIVVARGEERFQSELEVLPSAVTPEASEE